MDFVQMTYLLPLILLLLTFCGQSHAFTTQTPEISGYNNRTMKLTGGSGGFAGGTYSRTGTVVINGKTVPIPGSLKPSSGMGNIIKNALKLNPYKIAGTLAAGWLIDQGLQWMEDTQQWVKSSPASGPVEGKYWRVVYRDNACATEGTNCTFDGAKSAYVATFKTFNAANNPSNEYWGPAVATGDPTLFLVDFYYQENGVGSYIKEQVSFYSYGAAPDEVKPMTDAEWDALADPMPTVGAEAPLAPYLPEGVTIVEPPAYTPQTVTVGAPYTKPDGSTAQPMAKISPAGDGQVTTDTYEQPLTNPDGTPVPADAPINDIKEEPAPPKDPCIENPGRLGCMEAGTDEFAMPKSTVDFTFTPEASPIGAGSCPAPINVLGHTISYQPACDAMGMIRALIIAMSSLMAAYILIGAFKSE